MQEAAAAIASFVRGLNREGAAVFAPKVNAPAKARPPGRANAWSTVMPAPEPVLSVGSTLLSRKCATCEDNDEQALHAKPAGTLKSGSEAPAIVHEVLRTSGKPLDPDIRGLMESRFQHDFARVRVHADSQAAASAWSLNAVAYTVGSDIVFGRGQYRPGTSQGRRLLAHELSHVVQQAAAPSSPPASVEVASPTSTHEAEADRMAATALSPQRPSPLPQSRQPVSAPRGRSLLQRSVSTEAAVGIVVGGAAIGGLIGLAAGPAGALVGALIGGAMAGGALLAEKYLSADKDRPDEARGPDLLDNPKAKEVFEAKLREGLGILHGQKTGCAFPQGRPWNFDTERWIEQPRPGSKTQETEYRYTKGSSAAGVDDLFAHLDLWECDCAMYTEIATLYAVRHTLGTDAFNQRFPDLRLRTHESVGAPRETQTRPPEDDLKPRAQSAKEQKDFDKSWVDAPVGTEVAWQNISGAWEPSWEFEHAIKVVKGTEKSGAGDRYDAHPISAARYKEGKATDLTEEEIKLAMARHSKDAPTKFNPTPETWKKLQAADIAPDIIRVVQAIDITQFRTHDALVNGLIAALRAAPKRVTINGETMSKLVSTLIDASVQDESELQDYARNNIVRSSVARLRL